MFVGVFVGVGGVGAAAGWKEGVGVLAGTARCRSGRNGWQWAAAELGGVEGEGAGFGLACGESLWLSGIGSRGRERSVLGRVALPGR